MSEGNKNAYEMLASQVSDYVQAHLDEKMTLDDLAHHVGVSKYHLNRLFQAATGFQLGEFMQRRRMQAAYALLAKGNCTVIDASLVLTIRSPAFLMLCFMPNIRQFVASR
jgi:AraC family transcriptional regulator